MLCAGRTTCKMGLTRHRVSGGTRLSSSSAPSSSFVFYYNDIYKVPLPPSHKFPMEKYKYVRENLQDHIDPRVVEAAFKVSPLATVDELTTTHCPEYVRRYMSGELTEKEIRATGFPWSEAGVNRSLSSVGGTLACMRHVMDRQRAGATGAVKVAAHLAGGTHHAFYDRGEGFCLFSDIAVAANCSLREYPEILDKKGADKGRILIIDLDVHQGNGNAKLFEDDPRVFTFNMHCSGNLFSQRQSSDIDVDVPNGCSGDEYLKQLSNWLPFLFENIQPQLIFFQAGVDVLENDRLGKLKLKREDVRKRNSLVYEEIRKLNVPLVVTLGGGYPKDISPDSASFKEVIGAHTDVYTQIVDTWRV
jgi:acetoin utilization deacetylase AcuC-like enzyme